MTPSFISAVHAARDRLIKANLDVLAYVMQSASADYFLPEGIRTEVSSQTGLCMDAEFHELFDKVIEHHLKPFEWRAMGLPELCQSYLQMQDCEARRMLKARVRNQFGSHYNQVQIEWGSDARNSVAITLANGTQTINQIKIWL